jgi:hypothetical protein
LDGLLAIYVMNFIVMLSMLIATLYRAWIEKENLEARRRLEKMRKVFKKYRDDIENMSPKEFVEMLRLILDEN